MKKLYFIIIMSIPGLLTAQISEIDINPAGDSSPNTFVDFAGQLVFVASDGTTGVEPWISDGTTVGTTILKNINAGATAAGNSNPDWFTVFNGEVYFRAGNGTDLNGAELWKSDGTEVGTIQIEDIQVGTGSSNPQHFFVFNGNLYFQANDVSSTQLWETNGTPNTAIKVTTQRSNGFAGPSLPMVATNGVFYRANDNNGNELSYFNGSTGVELLDIRPGASAGYLIANDRRNALVFGNSLLFEADDTGTNDELWISDGTTVGTTLLREINPSGDSNPDYFVLLAGEAYFSADSGTGAQLWKTDGTNPGTVLVMEPNVGGDAAITDIFSDGTTLFFGASNGTDGVELWKYDTTNGASLVKDINIGAGSSSPSGFVALSGLIYFSADDGTGPKLWVTDGTGPGTVSVASQFGASEDPTGVSNITVSGTKLYFSGTGANGAELFVFDPATLSTENPETEIVRLYPNPVKNTINFTKNMVGSAYILTDLTGREVKKGTLSDNNIQLNEAQGVYLLKLSKEGRTTVKKVIIE